jgi:AcrR family transcriptional regulator
VPRKKREEEIIQAIREYLIDAVQSSEAITDRRLMKAAKCAPATFYKYVSEGSLIEQEIEAARVKQQRYAEAGKRREGEDESSSNSGKRLFAAEEGNRKLLAFITQMIDNLVRAGVPIGVIQQAQREAMSHPHRSFSHAGRGRHSI